ncbi:dihydrofolate reductase family protein [Kutzneria sp. CA-103260]|uniref:dihydrofolate reductase family protein n=1 Tax=Kutzneria sp. CA-103260 TaxID=2802641 RepID=UPI001BA801FD|nr:dihydrofolate reductase family protein [Kutzneria sp. CA-103260]QUQ68568.1 deaminase-reductase domain-containing protein [Kutzneria sp. CA-103260]
MSEVIANMSMSLDGFVADTDDGIEQVFGWYGSGDVAVPTAVEWATFRTSEASAGVLRHGQATIGALLGGRRLFDLTSGWNGTHPMGVPVVIVTHTVPTDWAHPEAPFTFVTDGIESAVAKAKAAAGGKNVAVASPTIVRQCLDAGLLDAVQVDLVPVLLGKGIPFFGELATGPVQLDGPTVVEGEGVTHLTYRVRR